jgi:hypothetical protein
MQPQAVQSDPGPENLAARDAIACECLDSIHRPIVAEYMARQWEAGQ